MQQPCVWTWRCVIATAAISLTLAAWCRDASGQKAAPSAGHDKGVADPPWLRQALDNVCRQRRVPGIAACLVIGGKVAAASAVGRRKADDETPVTREDVFHLGSIAKPMTATLWGVLVEQRKLRWDMTIEQMFPDLRGDMQPAYRKVIVLQLLGHTSGLAYQPRTPEAETDRRGATTADKRYEYVRAALADEPEATPGTKFIYGGGSIVAASCAERIMKRPYEELMQEYVFRRLGMTSAGFGPMATPPNHIDGPWEHIVENGAIKPLAPDATQVSQARAPAGRNVHCSVLDLGRFAAAHLQGARGKRSVVGPTTFRVLQTVVPPGHHTSAWSTARVDWARGTVFWHNGSTGKNYALVHIIPEENYATCVMTNIGGDRAIAACDETHRFLVEQAKARFLSRLPSD
jgi:CubicO group peptidase (beta-lactamase class C family)